MLWFKHQEVKRRAYHSGDSGWRLTVLFPRLKAL